MTTPRILFILKYRSYGGTNNINPKLSSGLLNSAYFVHQLLVENGIISKLVQVVDNNSIDREVTAFKPTHVIIEALWVVPEKFSILSKLHPNVTWIIRNHSEIPFIANEGISIEWIKSYINDHDNIIVASNSARTNDDLKTVIEDSTKWHKLILLPNYYPIKSWQAPAKRHKWKGPWIDIGCFGAIRPMKNQLTQAIAAIEFGKKIKKEVVFHINSERIEGRGEPILKNLRALFKDRSDAVLIEHPWMPHTEYTKLLRETIDIGMQVSFSESFNIVSADFVSNGIPIVVSNQIDWMPDMFKPNDSTSVDDIVDRLDFAWDMRNRPWIDWIFNRSLINLKNYCDESKRIWINTFSSK